MLKAQYECSSIQINQIQLFYYPIAVLYSKNLQHVTMTNILFLSTIILAFIFPFIAGSPSSEFQTQKLTEKTLTQFINRNRYVFIYFYKQKCTDCIPTEIEFNRLAKQSLNSTTVLREVLFAEVNGTKQVQLVKKYSITNFPALFFIDQTFVIKYDGGVGLTLMKNWIQDYLGNRIISLKQYDLEQISKLTKPFLLLINPTQLETTILNKALYKIPIIKAYSVRSPLHESSFPSSQISLSLHFKNRTLPYLGQTQRISLNKWIKQNTMTSIIALDNNPNTNKVMFNQQQIPGLIFIFGNIDDRVNMETYQILEQVCDQFVGAINCGEIIPAYQSFKGAHGYFKVKDTNSTVIGLVKRNMNIAYRMNMAYSIINKQSLVTFVEQSLSDNHPRTVDNVAPEKISFSIVKVYKQQQLSNLIAQNKYVFVNFYDPSEEGSLYFSRLYETFAKICQEDDSTKEVIVIGVSCGTGQCVRKFQHFPYLQFYINGIPIQYEKTPRVPEVPELTRFINLKMQRKYLEHNIEQLTTKKTPYVILVSKEIPRQLQVLPALRDSLTFYHKKDPSQQKPRLQLHTYDDIKAPTQNLDPIKISQWLSQETQLLLADLMAEEQDQKIVNAVKNKQPIMFLLDFDRQNSKNYRARLGVISKKLGLCGAYAESSKQAYRSLMDWIGLEDPKNARVIYADLKEDKRYAYYAENPEQLTLSGIQQFIEKIKGKGRGPNKRQESSKKQENEQL